VDCWAPDIKYNSKLENQDRKNNIIMRENRIMLKKIHQVESQYPTRIFLEDWKKIHEAVETMQGSLINIPIKQKILL